MQMPLVDALLRASAHSRVSWHMPGNRGGQAWPTWFRDALATIDLTELPITDDLHHPTGAASQAMEQAAAAFGSSLCRMITSGSTTALQILLAICVGKRGRLLLPRSSHQAVFNAAALLDLDLRWLSAELDGNAAADPYNLIPTITADAVEAGLQANPDCSAVLLTRPDYYGGCCELAPIAEVVHRHQALLIVDEAHGAHLAFGRGVLPPSAMQSGADACVQSGHKTLPVLTPGAWLHVSAEALQSGRLTAADLDRAIPVFQTSSPSFPIAATLDFARAWLETAGSEAISRQLQAGRQMAARLTGGFSCPDHQADRDPLRLVIRYLGEGTAAARGKAPALAAAAWLARQGIDIEFADLTRLVLIPALDQPADAWRQLSDSLNQFAEQVPVSDPNIAGAKLLDDLEKTWRHFLATPAEAAVAAGEVLFSRRYSQRSVALETAAGAICSRPIMPYPPGIPILEPGEVIDEARVDFLRQLVENEISISGIDQDHLWVLA